jgi:ribosomal 30S subunit maturation factor RimM
VQLVVGRVGRPHGLRGEVSVEVRTDDPDQRFSIGSALVTIPAERGPLTVAGTRWHWNAAGQIRRMRARTIAEAARHVLAIDSGDRTA